MTDRARIQTWARDLVRRSVLKQAKWKALRRVARAGEGMRCLDLGSDNGVISLLLRDSGGTWRSADLDPDAVECIRQVVGDPVDLLDGPRLPYPDASFDLVVVVDLLEHVEQDAVLAAELARVLAPGGRLVLNVPRLRPRSLLRRLRLRIGLTDEKHGHVRPGYGKEGLRRLFAGCFDVGNIRTYVGPCSDLVDLALSWYLERKRAGRRIGASKGGVVTPWSEEGAGVESSLYRLAYPFLKAFSLLDVLFLPLPGAMLVATLHRRGDHDGAHLP